MGGLVSSSKRLFRISLSFDSGFELLVNSVSASAFYNAAYTSNLPKRHLGNCFAVLDRIKDWILQKTCVEAPLMWLCGEPGSGKSSIARSIAGWCDSQTEKLLLASFFFHSDFSTSNTDKFVATLAFNMTVSVPDSRVLIEEAIKCNPCIFALSLEAQISRLMLKPFAQLAQSQQHLPRVIIVDGLDQCQPDEQTNILTLLSSLPKSQDFAGWKILVTSRIEPPISVLFDQLLIDKTCTRISLSDEYPIAAYRNDKEMANQHTFTAFVDVRAYPCQ